MSDDAWLTDGPLRPLLDALVEDALRRYRIERPAAQTIIKEVLCRNRELRRLAETEPAADKIRRTAAFKRAAADAKRRVYYHLRRYQAGGDLESLVARLEAWDAAAPADQLHALALAAAGAHKSTAERMASLEDFHRQLFEHLGDVRTVLDAGCGMYPLVFPFDGAGSGVVHYVAADSSPLAVAAVSAYARARRDGRLVALRWDIQDGWAAIVRQCDGRAFDAALLLKLVPVVDRQARRLLPILAQTPARTWVLSGSQVSLTKRTSIAPRERAVLRRFVASAGREVRAEFVAGEEFAWIVR